MSREEAKKILGENATEEQITNLLNAYHTDVNSKNEEINDLKAKLTSSEDKVSKLSNVEKELDELKKSKMTEQELFEQQKKDLAKQISDNKKLGNSMKAKSVLIGAGITNEKADELVSRFVKEDESATMELANLLVNELQTVKENTEKEVTAKLSSIDLRPNGSNVQPNDDKKMSWEKFDKMTAEEQNKFAEENPDEFNNL